VDSAIVPLRWSSRIKGDSVKRVLKAMLFIVATTVGLTPQEKPSHKATCSLAIRPLQTSVKAGSPVQIEATITNTSKYVLNNSRPLDPGEYYSFDVRHEGSPAAETEVLQQMIKPGNSAPEKKAEGPLGGASRN
jgi:hypothetical protein